MKTIYMECTIQYMYREGIDPNPIITAGIVKEISNTPIKYVVLETN